MLIRVGNPLVEPPHRPKLPDFVPPFVKELCHRCWHPSPACRPEFAKIAEQLDNLPYEVLESTSLALREAREKRQGQGGGLALGGREGFQASSAFPPHMQRALDEGRPMKPGNIDQVSIVVVGVQLPPVGATAGLAPEQVADVYSRVETVLAAIATRHRLFRMDTVDGSFMVCGNVIEHGESGDHCVRAAYFALDAVREVGGLPVSSAGSGGGHGAADLGFVSVCAGFHAGPVTAIVTSRGDSHSKQFSLIGDAVNTAIRLEEYSERQMVNMSMDASAILLRQSPDNSFRISRRGSVRMQDRWPMELFWLLSPRSLGKGTGPRREQLPQVQQAVRPESINPWAEEEAKLQVVVQR